MATAPSDRGPVRGRLDGQDRLISADPRSRRAPGRRRDRTSARNWRFRRSPRSPGSPESWACPSTGMRLPPGRSMTSNCGSARRPRARRSRFRSSAGSIARPRLRASGRWFRTSSISRSARRPRNGRRTRIFRSSPSRPASRRSSGTTAEEAIGKPLTRFLRLEENEDGELPLARRGHVADRLRRPARTPRRGSDEVLILRGTPVTSPDGRFAGFQGEALGESASVDRCRRERSRGRAGRASSTRRFARRSIGSSKAPTASCSSRTVRCAATMPIMPSDIAAAARHLLSVIRSMNGETGQDKDRVDLVALATEAIGLLEATAHGRKA